MACVAHARSPWKGDMVFSNRHVLVFYKNFNALMNIVVFIATTAFHVNKKGAMGMAFESQIRDKQSGNPRFDFLKASSPYHAWYRQKVKEASEGRDVKAEAEAHAVRRFC